jgi:hypothetical protein
VVRPSLAGQEGMRCVGVDLHHRGCKCGSKGVGCKSHTTKTLLHDEADHCLVLVVGAMRSSSRKERPLVCSGPVEDCR